MGMAKNRLLKASLPLLSKSTTLALPFQSMEVTSQILLHESKLTETSPQF